MGRRCPLGCFDLFSFDGKTLQRQAANNNSFPGNGRARPERRRLMTSSWTYRRLRLCYAQACAMPTFRCNVDGSKLVDVALTPLPQTAAAGVRDLNNRCHSGQRRLRRMLSKPSARPSPWCRRTRRSSGTTPSSSFTANAQAKNITGGYPRWAMPSTAITTLPSI